MCNSRWLFSVNLTEHQITMLIFEMPNLHKVVAVQGIIPMYAISLKTAEITSTIV